MLKKSDEAKRQQIEKMYNASKRHFPEVAELAFEELPGLRERERVVLVDVRSPAEQEVSMIAGAITADDFLEHRADHEGATVVAYCTIGHRSGLFAQELSAEGWRVFNLKGAILSWTHGGGALENADGPTQRVHVYSRQCNLTAEGYEAVW
jgi:sodium/bile acid cotransporter 7